VSGGQKKRSERKMGSLGGRDGGDVTYQKCIHCLSTVYSAVGGGKGGRGNGLGHVGGGPRPLCTLQSGQLSRSLQGSSLGHSWHVTHAWKHALHSLPATSSPGKSHSSPWSWSPSTGAWGSDCTCHHAMPSTRLGRHITVAAVLVAL
jgi:hypothetical protein